MEENLSDILDNVLGLLLLEGSYDIQESEDGLLVNIQTPDAGRLIGSQGDSLSALQFLVNMMLSHKLKDQEAQPKRVILDVEGWRKSKEEQLAQKAKNWAQQVLETQKPIELEPMPSWQRRIIHMTVQEAEGVESESVGEGLERHLVIKPTQ